ncbi:MAG: hypothetical protein QJR07_08245 [Acetobacteraceae bacterium]|nr:hypothetical protein [Acetobacteraceae bacterium]
MIRRRSFLGLSLALLPAAAFAQTATAPAQPQRRRMADRKFDDLTSKQKRRVEQRLAGTGHQPLSAEEARRRWDGMSTKQRQMAMRNPIRKHRNRHQPAQPQQPAQPPAAQQPPA